MSAEKRLKKLAKKRLIQEERIKRRKRQKRIAIELCKSLTLGLTGFTLFGVGASYGVGLAVSAIGLGLMSIGAGHAVKTGVESVADNEIEDLQAGREILLLETEDAQKSRDLEVIEAVFIDEEDG